MPTRPTASTGHSSLTTLQRLSGVPPIREGDGNVTLQEAFDYARDRTVRDSARLAKTPQHPSFDLALRGRQDIVLAVLPTRTSALQIKMARAPIEIIQLPSGVTVADVPPQGGLRIALPPGRYLVRSVVDGRVYAKEVEVRPGETSTLADGELEAIGNEQLAIEGSDEEEPAQRAPNLRLTAIVHVEADHGRPRANLTQRTVGAGLLLLATGISPFHQCIASLAPAAGRASHFPARRACWRANRRPRQLSFQGALHWRVRHRGTGPGVGGCRCARS